MYTVSDHAIERWIERSLTKERDIEKIRKRLVSLCEKSTMVQKQLLCGKIYYKHLSRDKYWYLIVSDDGMITTLYQTYKLASIQGRFSHVASRSQSI